MRTEAVGRAWSLFPKPKAEWDGIRTPVPGSGYIPPVGTGGDLFHHPAESAFCAHRGRRPSVEHVPQRSEGMGFEPPTSSISYEANAHSRNIHASLEKSILVNEIPPSLVFMILISSMKIED